MNVFGPSLDNKFSWRRHIERVSKTFAATVKKLRNLSYLPANFLEEIDYKTIFPTVLYAISLYCGAYLKYLLRGGLGLNRVGATWSFFGKDGPNSCLLPETRKLA